MGKQLGESMTARIRVLIADDSDDIRLMLRTALESDGRFEIVGEAIDGDEAARMAGDLRPRAVVLDLAMPKVDGLDAIPMIKGVAPETRVLVFTCSPAALKGTEATALGADAYLEKTGGLGPVVRTLASL